MLCKPVFVVDRSRPVRKMPSFTRYWRELRAISLLFEIFRRLNSIFIAFYTPIATHAVFNVESCPTVRTMRPFTPFWRKLCAVSILLEIFRRLNATSTAFHTPNATHAVFSVETIPIVRKMRPFTPFWRKLSVISILFEIVRRLRATSIAFYTSNAMHASFIVEWNRPVRKMRSCTRLWRKLCVITLLLEIFRRLNSISIPFYSPNATHAVFSDETSPTVRKMRPLTRFCRKLCGISILLEIFLRLNAISIAFYTPSAMHANFIVERSRSVRKMRPFTSFWRKLSVISLVWEIFRRLNAISIAFYTPIATHAVFSVESIPTVRKMRPFTPFWRKLSVLSILL